MWSVVEKTALAEAEVEYHDHTSTTIWVRFPLIEASRPGSHGCSRGDLDHDALDHPGQPRRRLWRLTSLYRLIEVGEVAGRQLGRARASGW